MPKHLKISQDNEKQHLESLELLVGEVIIENVKGVINNFYGNRLRFLMAFYDKKLDTICEAIFVNKQKVSYWTRNLSKPNSQELEKLALLFEVPESFFTDSIIKIRITQQLKIEII